MDRWKIQEHCLRTGPREPMDEVTYSSLHQMTAELNQRARTQPLTSYLRTGSCSRQPPHTALKAPTEHPQTPVCLLVHH